MILAVLVAVLVGGIAYCIHWDFDQTRRWASERARYELRLQARQPMPTEADYLECTRAAMAITVRRYSARLDTLIADRVAVDRFARDADRAHGMLESALAGSSAGLRVVR